MRLRKTVKGVALPLVLGLGLGLGNTASAACGPDAYIGSICLVGYTFCPRGTTEASGQLLPIASNTALFSLYGTTYGGDGRTTFALPDLRGRAPIGAGNGPGLPSYNLGQRGGAASTTLNTSQLPSHNHGVNVTLRANGSAGNSDSPANNVLAQRNRTRVYSTSGANTDMSPGAVQVTQNNVGGNQAVSTQSPYLAMRYCVNLQGIFPSRN